ncbi:hypothetical protein NQZ68_033453, partial [Dissostichus eleginoides]
MEFNIAEISIAANGHFLTGSSPLTAGHYMIAEDQTIVSGSVPNVVDALMLMFAAYYFSVIAQNWELPWSSCRDGTRSYPHSNDLQVTACSCLQTCCDTVQ